MVMTLDSDVSNLLGEYAKEEADLVRKEFCSRHPQSPQSLHLALVPPEMHAGLHNPTEMQWVCTSAFLFWMLYCNHVLTLCRYFLSSNLIYRSGWYLSENTNCSPVKDKVSL